MGSLAAGSINTTADVGTLLVPVEQSEGTFSIGNEKHTGFFSRDYDVSYSTSSAIAVGKRALNVTLGNIKGTYGAVAPAFTWTYDQDAQPVGGGLASFDTEATVFQEDPTLEIDARVTGSSDFRSLSVKRDANGSVAAYEGAVFATGGSAANYEVTFTKGDLTVEPESLADAARIIAGADTTAFTYNGSIQAPAALSVTDAGSELTENTDYTVSLPTGSKDAGDYAVTLTGMGNYTGTATVAYTIAPAPLSVITKGASKVYDGTPLTAPGALHGLADGDTVTFATTGSQTDPGSSKNTYTLDWDGTAKFTNYDVWENLGTLTVTEAADQIVVTTTGGTFEHDGRPHGASVTVSQLPAGLRVVEAESSATATHVSDGEVKATADKLKIVNELGEDVTDKLSISYVDGTISIVPRRLFVSTKGGTKLYDGTPLAAIKGAKLEGLVAGDTAMLVATGSQTDAGSSPNTYQIQWGTAQADDYQVSESLGTLTVYVSSYLSVSFLDSADILFYFGGAFIVQLGCRLACSIKLLCFGAQLITVPCKLTFEHFHLFIQGVSLRLQSVLVLP